MVSICAKTDGLIVNTLFPMGQVTCADLQNVMTIQKEDVLRKKNRDAALSSALDRRHADCRLQIGIRCRETEGT